MGLSAIVVTPTPRRCAGLIAGPILPARQRNPNPPKLIAWTIYKIAAKQSWMALVDATDEREAIEKAAEELKTEAQRLIAVRHRTPPEPPRPAV